LHAEGAEYAHRVAGACGGTVSTVTPDEVLEALTTNFAGLVPKATWGETSLFYNPDGILPNGVYFCTIKERDGANDRASQLDRPGVFRLAVGLPPARYEQMFGPRPARPSKGGVVSTADDFTAADVLMPHPVYAWMGWVQVLSPSAATFAELQPLLASSYELAVLKYDASIAERASS
jgi:hypothetical protein